LNNNYDIQKNDGDNIDRLGLFRYLTGKILTNNTQTMCNSYGDITFEKENLDVALAKRQIRQ